MQHCFMILIAKCILIKSTLLKCIFEGAPGLHIFCEFIAPKASAEGACIFSKLVTVERVLWDGLL